MRAAAIEPLSPVAGGIGAPGVLRLLIGDLVVGQQVELVLRVRFPKMPEGAQASAFFTIADRDGVLKADGCTLAWTHTELDELAGQLIAEEAAFSSAMAKMDCKRRHFTSTNIQRWRGTDGQALALTVGPMSPRARQACRCSVPMVAYGPTISCLSTADRSVAEVVSEVSR
jgi:hypothetical protein